MLKEHLKVLGHKVRDRVTGIEGVATSVSFDLYGCIQVCINPGVDSDGRQKEQGWFDIPRLEVISHVPVMSPPCFTGYSVVAAGKKGAAEKPAL